MLARESFDRELGQLEAEVILLGGMVENAIFEALAALKERDLARSQTLIDNDDEIDEKEWSIERGCIRLLRREAPLARDLRRIITILELANELERMGDYAEGIAKLSLMMGDEPPLKELIDIPVMGDIAVSMVKRSLEAFLERDPDKVIEISQTLVPDDDRVDEINRQVRYDLFELMKASPENVVRGTYLLWAAHNIERIADRATNIAERAIYQATGEQVNVGAGDPTPETGNEDPAD